MGLIRTVRRSFLPASYTRGNVELQLSQFKRVGGDKYKLNALLTVKRGNNQVTERARLRWSSDNEGFKVVSSGVSTIIDGENTISVVFNINELNLDKTLSLNKSADTPDSDDSDDTPATPATPDTSATDADESTINDIAVSDDSDDTPATPATPDTSATDADESTINDIAVSINANASDRLTAAINAMTNANAAVEATIPYPYNTSV